MLRYIIISVAAFLGATIIYLPHSHAYAQSKDVLEQQFDTVFNQMLQNPADKKITRKYADIAQKMGDFESAIPPLERLLMQEPENAMLKVEIGKMYFNLKSYDMAQFYFKDAKSMQKISSDTQKEADNYLEQLKWKIY